MAPQQLVSCNHDSGVMGCRGAATGNAYGYFVREGLVEDSCYPYKSGATGSDGTCYKSCSEASGSGSFDQLHCKEGSIEVIASDAGKNDEYIRSQLVAEGPMHLSFKVPSSFM